MNHGESQKAPGDGGAQTDVAVQVEAIVAVIPVTDLEEGLHRGSGEVFEDRSSYCAEEEGKENIAPDRNGHKQHNDGSGTVEGKKRSAHKATVDPFLVLNGNIGGFKAPAEEAVDVEEHQPVHGGIGFIAHRLTPFLKNLQVEVNSYCSG